MFYDMEFKVTSVLHWSEGYSKTLKDIQQKK